MSDNPEVLIIWHVANVVSRLEVLLFTRKKLSVKQADLRDMFKQASQSFCPSTIMVSPNPPSPSPSTSSAIKTPENPQEDPDDPE
jgi:hypothetical protein